MSKEFKCTMKLSNGKVNNTNPVGYKQFVDLLEEGEELIVTFKRKKFEKTNPQLRLANHLLSELSRETGNPIEGLDLYVKHKIGKCYTEKVADEEVLICTSKADFNKDDMEQYLNVLLGLSQEYGIETSQPL